MLPTINPNASCIRARAFTAMGVRKKLPKVMISNQYHLIGGDAGTDALSVSYRMTANTLKTNLMSSDCRWVCVF